MYPFAMTDELKTIRFNMVVTPSLVSMVDEWRKSQKGLPSRSEAVRSLVELGLSAPSFAPDVAAGVAESAAKLRKSEAYVVEIAVKQFLRERNMLPNEDDQPTS